MSEIRVDPLSGLRTIVAPGRADRDADRDRDPFAEGNESLTPPEVFAIRPDGHAAGHARAGCVRAFPNRFPALDAGCRAARRATRRPDLFTAVAGAGAHEVIVNSPPRR